jgi:tryptophan synthase alpha chain
MNNSLFKKDKKQTSIFVTAGFPKIDSLKKQIIDLQEKGVDFIEVGIPFSDPMADGEKIQETSTVAIENGMTIKLLFDQLNEIKENISIPLVMMSYFNPIFTFGLKEFLKNCQQVNIQNVIIPDISMEVYERNYKSLFEEYNINVCFLVTPNSENERIQKMAGYSKNAFVYLVSQNSTTGTSKNGQINTDLHKRYSEIKLLCGDTPLMIGFGIKNREDLQMAQNFADGGIIGTAYLNAVSENSEGLFISNLLN